MSKQAIKRIELLFLLIVLSLILGANWTPREEPISVQASLDSGLAAFALLNPGAPLVSVSPEERDAVVAEVMANMWRYRSDPSAPRPEPRSVDAVNGILVYVDEAGHLAQANADGTNHVTLDDTVSNAASAQWSPDENVIVFVGDGAGENAGGPCIYTLTYTDRQLTTVTCEPEAIWKPYWSADGQYLAFFGKANAADADMRAWIVPKSGGGLQRIASGLMNIWDPSWIDNDTVVFSGESPADKWRIYTADIGQLNQPKAITPEFSCECTAESVVAGTPSISPDGNWLGFVAARTEGGKLGGSTAYAAVYIVPPDGRRPPVKLGDIADTTTGYGSYNLLQWSPNNQHIGVLGSGSDQKMRLNLLEADSNDEVTVLHSREGGNWSTWTWSPDSLLTATGHHWPEKPWEVNTLFVGSDSFQRLLMGHSPDWRSAGNDAAFCAGVATGQRPVLLVTGWGGSERNPLNKDQQLGFFLNYFLTKKYKEGCNLFYATGTSATRSLADNGKIIRDNLCSDYHKVKAFDPQWDGTFALIGYSYGGLRARAFLETGDIYDGEKGTTCNGYNVKVQNLITLGTPHGGEPFPSGELKDLLPLAGYIGLCALAPSMPYCAKGGSGDAELWALFEMWPGVRTVENLIQRQPDHTCYSVISGDARWQYGEAPWKLKPILAPALFGGANDFAVHQASSFVLSTDLLAPNYPRVENIGTGDVHGYVPEEEWWSTEHNLTSYVEPNYTFNQVVFDRLNKPCNDSRATTDLDANVEAVMVDLQAATTTSATPQTDLASGVMTPDEALTGQFAITEADSATLALYWGAGEVEFNLTDPAGSVITPTVSLPTVAYFDVDTGFSQMAAYQFTEMPVGTWAYQVIVRDVEIPVPYRLLYLPERPIALSLTAPQWLPGGQPLAISAQLTHGDTPLLGGSVTVKIARPDGSTRTLTLYDDGAHNDGAAGDATFANTYTDTSQGGFYGLLATAAGTYDAVAYQRTASTLVAVAPRADLTGKFTDAPVDADKDRYYEHLAFNAETTIGETGKYGLSGELWSGSRLIGRAETTVDLNSGKRTIVLAFRSSDIYDSHLNGPYQVRNLILTDQSQATILIESIDNAHQTAAYDYRQFATPRKSFVPGIFRGR